MRLMVEESLGSLHHFPTQQSYILLWLYEASRLWRGRYRATLGSSETADMAMVLAIKICGCAGKAGTNIMSAAAMTTRQSW